MKAVPGGEMAGEGEDVVVVVEDKMAVKSKVTVEGDVLGEMTVKSKVTVEDEVLDEMAVKGEVIEIVDCGDINLPIILFSLTSYC